jgi:hypothetical protein
MTSRQDTHTTTLRAWHLALLRFAVTREVSDMQAAWAIAAELDRLGTRDRDSATFGFFRRSTQELCAALLQPGSPADAIVHRHLARMPDDRLKRALQAALGPLAQAVIENFKTTQSVKSARRNSNLWKGLESRRTSSR